MERCGVEPAGETDPLQIKDSHKMGRTIIYVAGIIAGLIGDRGIDAWKADEPWFGYLFLTLLLAFIPTLWPIKD